MIENSLNSQLLDIAMENTYLLLTDSKRFNEVFQNENEFVVAFDLEQSNVNFNKTLRWYKKIKRSNKAKVKTIHLEKMKKWTYDKKKRSYKT